MSRPMVIVGMGAADHAHDERLRELADRYGATVAYLQIGEPALRAELTRLADSGVDGIVLVGAAFGTAPGNSWLRRAAAHWWRERPGAPTIEVASGLLDDVDDDVEEVLRRARPITGGEAGLSSPAWEDVPRHRHQVFVCRGPRCTARGADLVGLALTRALAEAGLGDDDVLVTQTGCQFPCNQAPVVVVHPDDAWYGRLDPATAGRVVAEHLVEGGRVHSHLLRRHPADPDGRAP